MGLETGTYISDLVSTNPTSSDPKSQGDDHLRLIKATVKATFPNVSGAVTPTHTELNYVDGVTSAIQTQLDAKAPLASPVLTGVPEAPTATVGNNTTQIATTAFVVATSLASSLPGQTGKDFYLLSTDGATADWYNTIDTSVVTPVSGTAFATTTGTQSLSNKSLTVPVIQDSSDTTKKANFVCSGITAGQNRNITVEDKNVLLMTPGWVYLSTVTASASATVDLETTLNSTYDRYAIVITDYQPATNSTDIWVRLKIAGSYHAGASDYYWTRVSQTTSTTIGTNHAGDTKMPIVNSVSNTATRKASGIIYLDTPSSTSISKQISWDLAYSTGTDVPAYSKGMGIDISSTGAVTGVRILSSSGNITTGTFVLFGLRKA